MKVEHGEDSGLAIIIDKADVAGLKAPAENGAEGVRTISERGMVVTLGLARDETRLPTALLDGNYLFVTISNPLTSTEIPNQSVRTQSVTNPETAMDLKGNPGGITVLSELDS